MPKKPSDKEKGLLFEQYKLVVQIADNLTERRSNLNKFYITLLSSLFAVMLLQLKGELQDNIANFILLIISLSGIIICYMWRSNIKSYKLLSKAKFNLINDMEKHLPYKYFTEEWNLLLKDKYKGLTKWELRLPFAIGVLYCISLIYSLIPFGKTFIEFCLCMTECI